MNSRAIIKGGTGLAEADPALSQTAAQQLIQILSEAGQTDWIIQPIPGDSYTTNVIPEDMLPKKAQGE